MRHVINSQSNEAPNHALQRTAPAVTLAASGLRLSATIQPARQPPQSLSLGSFCASNRECPLLSDKPHTNPYEPPRCDTNSRARVLSGFHGVVLALLVIVLLVRGVFMAFEWARLLFSGVALASHFYRAIFLKDAIYGVTALIGGLLLTYRLRVGWWFATIHWSWYLACEVLVVVAAESMSWRFPVRHEPAQLFTSVTKSLALAGVALMILLWKPVMAHCNVGPRRRTPMVGSLLVGCFTVALLVNWWSSMK